MALLGRGGMREVYRADDLTLDQPLHRARPYVRRLWPDSLLGWSRLMAGHLRDPRVGCDVLIGVAVGVAVSLLDVARATALPSLRSNWTMAALSALTLCGFYGARAGQPLPGTILKV